MIAERLRADLTAAMRRRDDVATATLRMALAAVQQEAVAGKEARVLSEDELLGVLKREVKRREEAAEAFRLAGRDDRVERELAERDVLAAYLPAPLSPADLDALVDEVLADGGFSGASSMGPAMKAVTARVAGRADGKAVAELVKRRLGA